VIGRGVVRMGVSRRTSFGGWQCDSMGLMRFVL